LEEPDLSRLTLSRTAGGADAGRRRRGVRRIIVWAVVIVAVLAGGAVVVQKVREAPVEVEQASVTTAYPWQAVSVLTSTGYVVAQRKAAVASKATGRLEWLGVAEGSRVKQGDVIARLENRDVAAARDQAGANLKVARANRDQVKVELADALREQRRATDLLRQNFISESAHDTAVARVDKARAVLRSQEAAIAVAEANLRAAEVSVEQTLIRAPFEGVVLTKSANIGDVVTPFSSSLDAKGAVVTMADMATLEVEADVSEASLSKVMVDQAVEIQLDALPDRRFRGVVARMVPTVDRAKATVMTKIRFRDPDPRILPEMSAKVTFLSREVTDAEREPRVAVNPAAVVKRGGADVVFVVKDGIAKSTPVVTGARIGDLVELTRGVASGDKVVLKPGEKLVDGAAVKPVAK
jgi:HlyD family secretion protein